MKSTVYLLGNVNYLTKNKSTILFSLIKALSFNERVILLFLNSLTTLPSEPSRLLHFQAFHHRKIHKIGYDIFKHFEITQGENYDNR